MFPLNKIHKLEKKRILFICLFTDCYSGICELDFCSELEFQVSIPHILKIQVFRLSDFRQYQRAAVNAVLKKEDAIVVMSTGSGKSLCYQLPAVLAEGYSTCFSLSLKEKSEMTNYLFSAYFQA